MSTKRKQQILQSAAQLFKQRGYSAVTMRDIAQDLNIKAASLYNHISGKQEILSAIILNVAREFTTGMSKIQDDDNFAFAKAESLINLHITIACQHTNALALMNADWMHLEGDSFQEYTRSRKDYEARFKEIIAAGMDAKSFKNIEVETVAYSLLLSLRSLYLWIPKKSNKEIEQLKIELPELLLNGLKS